ncbi:MAG: methyltransferase domain-containing protein [Crenarchaeota archaeon]|nr:methyltransferase domain-containing protein [Thermoproteota archaeon]
MAGGKLAPWIPTPVEVIRVALRLAWVGPGDVLYDLGCGDGRVVVIAARDFGVRLAVGVEIDSLLAEAARYHARRCGVSGRVRIVEEDFRRVSLAPATVVYLYLYPSINEALRPKLEAELRPGSRVVTIDFPVPGWVPVRMRRVEDSRGITRTVRVYMVGLSDYRWRRPGSEVCGVPEAYSVLLGRGGS